MEDRLVSLENHTRVHLEVLVQVHPSAVCAWLTTVTICQDPCLLLLEELNRSLMLRKKSIANSNVALRSAPDNYRLALVFVIVNFTSGRASKNLEF